MALGSVLGTPTDSAGEHLFIIDVALHPAHQVLNIFRGGHLGGPLVILRVLPEVFESVSGVSQGLRAVSVGMAILVGCLHFGACLRRAELRYRAIEEVDLVVKVDHWRNLVSLSGVPCWET